MNTVPIRQLVVRTERCDPKRLDRNFIEYIDISSIDRNTKSISHLEKLRASEAPSRARKLVRANDVLVATVRPNLNAVAMVPPKYDREIASTGFCVLRAHETKLDPKYLFYFSQTSYFVSRLTRLAIGAGYPAVSDNDILDTTIPYIPLPEQQHAALILQKADRLRCLRRYAMKFSDTYIQSVFFEMFGDLRTNSSTYAVIPLGKICDVRDGTHDSPNYELAGYPLVTSKNLVNGYVDLTDVNYISEKDYIQINKRSKVDKGDLLMPMIGTIGNPVLIEHIPRYAVKNVAIIKFLPESPSNLYIRELLRGYYFDFVVSKNSRGGTQQFIALGDIRDFPIPLPTTTEQNRFTQIIQRFGHLQSQQHESERQAEHLFQTLLHRAFRGQLAFESVSL